MEPFWIVLATVGMATVLIVVTAMGLGAKATNEQALPEALRKPKDWPMLRRLAFRVSVVLLLASIGWSLQTTSEATKRSAWLLDRIDDRTNRLQGIAGAVDDIERNTRD